MESLPKTYQALVREDLTGKTKGVKSYPMPTEIPDGYVLVKMAYAPINPSDWMYFLHNIYGLEGTMTPPPTVGGFEGSGTVVKLGNGVDAELLGAKVGLTFNKTVEKFWGAWSEYSLVSKDNLFPFHKDTPLEDIHSVFVNPCTVFAMGEYFDSQENPSAVFNAGGSSLCRMVARYFKEKNIKTIMIVRREAHVKELLEAGANWVLDSSQSDYKDKLQKTLNEVQSKVFFDAVGGPDAMEVFNLMPNNSTLLNYGALSGKTFDGISAIDLIFKNKSIR